MRTRGEGTSPEGSRWSVGQQDVDYWPNPSSYPVYSWDSPGRTLVPEGPDRTPDGDSCGIRRRRTSRKRTHTRDDMRGFSVTLYGRHRQVCPVTTCFGVPVRRATGTDRLQRVGQRASSRTALLTTFGPVCVRNVLTPGPTPSASCRWCARPRVPLSGRSRLGGEFFFFCFFFCERSTNESHRPAAKLEGTYDRGVSSEAKTLLSPVTGPTALQPN